MSFFLFLCTYLSSRGTLHAKMRRSQTFCGLPFAIYNKYWPSAVATSYTRICCQFAEPQSLLCCRFGLVVAQLISAFPRQTWQLILQFAFLQPCCLTFWLKWFTPTPTPSANRHLRMSASASATASFWPNENAQALSRQLIKAPLAADKSFCIYACKLASTRARIWPSNWQRKWPKWQRARSASWVSQCATVTLTCVGFLGGISSSQMLRLTQPPDGLMPKATDSDGCLLKLTLLPIYKPVLPSKGSWPWQQITQCLISDAVCIILFSLLRLLKRTK